MTSVLAVGVLASGAGSYAQFVTVLVIFVIVLGVTALTTKWIAGFQRQQNESGNVEVIETSRIANNKYIQIVRAGEKYMVIAVCKDTVTMLCELPKEQLKVNNASQGMHFKDILDRVTKKNAGVPEEAEDDQVHDEV